VRQLLGEGPDQRDVVVAREAAGNPFFVTELVRGFRSGAVNALGEATWNS